MDRSAPDSGAFARQPRSRRLFRDGRGLSRERLAAIRRRAGAADVEARRLDFGPRACLAAGLVLTEHVRAAVHPTALRACVVLRIAGVLPQPFAVSAGLPQGFLTFGGSAARLVLLLQLFRAATPARRASTERGGRTRLPVPALVRGFVWVSVREDVCEASIRVRGESDGDLLHVLDRDQAVHRVFAFRAELPALLRLRDLGLGSRGVVDLAIVRKHTAERGCARLKLRVVAQQSAGAVGGVRHVLQERQQSVRTRTAGSAVSFSTCTQRECKIKERNNKRHRKYASLCEDG